MTLFLAVLLLSFVSAYVLTVLARTVARKLDILDYPDERKIHTHPIPYLGGAAIFLALLISCAFIVVATPLWFLFRTELEGVIIGGLIVVMFGLWDDVRGSGAIPKLAMQALVGIIMFSYGFKIEKISSPVGDAVLLGGAGVLLTILWYWVMMNAINIIDGLDGLATGVSAIAALTILIISSAGTDVGDPFALLLGAATIGAALGFLPHNFYPARIFLGDVGSMLLGFLLATLALRTSTKAPALLTLLIPVIAFGLPIFEAFYSFFRRFLTGAHPFRADKRHLHHRLLSLGFSHKRVVVLIYYGSLFLGVMAYILSKTSTLITVFVGAVLGLGLLLLIENLHFLADQRSCLSESRGEKGQPRSQL
jgi:UDP-GlcNAc:undecaprenyl-phosphate GlcNAc-1-phosphate transferase